MLKVVEHIRDFDTKQKIFTEMHHGHGHGHAAWQWTCFMQIYIHGENFVAVIGLSGSRNTVLQYVLLESQYPLPPCLSLPEGPRAPLKFKEEFNSRRPNPHVTSFTKQSLGTNRHGHKQTGTGAQTDRERDTDGQEVRHRRTGRGTQTNRHTNGQGLGHNRQEHIQGATYKN